MGAAFSASLFEGAAVRPSPLEVLEKDPEIMHLGQQEPGHGEAGGDHHDDHEEAF